MGHSQGKKIKYSCVTASLLSWPSNQKHRTFFFLALCNLSSTVLCMKTNQWTFTTCISQISHASIFFESTNTGDIMCPILTVYTPITVTRVMVINQYDFDDRNVMVIDIFRSPMLRWSTSLAFQANNAPSVILIDYCDARHVNRGIDSDSEQNKLPHSFFMDRP